MSLRPPRISLALTLLVTACSGGQSQQQDNHEEDSAGEAHAAPASGAKMSDFQRALKSFRQAAAQRLKQPENKLRVVPDAENQVGLPDAALPPFIAFQADAEDQIIRGLASPGGEVALVWREKIENLGPLLAAAHALDPKRALSAVEIAKRIVWLHGPGWTLIASGHGTWRASAPPADLAEPSLKSAGDGSAELRFLVNEAGGSGVVLGHQFTIRIEPGYKATATMTRVGG